MFDIVLVEPEIPPNTGNIMRLCVNAGCRLHLVRPLGFTLNDKQLARAGMDYRAGVDYTVHDDWVSCRQFFAGRRLFAVTTRGAHSYAAVRYQAQDVLVFGPESRGLPAALLETFPEQQRLRIPMRAHSRSLNLSNAVAITLYEAWRQLDFQAGI